MPGTTVRTLSVFVMDRSARSVRVSLSVALLLERSGSVAPAGGVIVAVLARTPVAVGLTWTVKVKVTLAPVGRSTVVARAPLPLDGHRQQRRRR